MRLGFIKKVSPVLRLLKTDESTMHITGFCDMCVPYTNDRKVLVDTVRQLIKCKDTDFIPSSIIDPSLTPSLPVGYRAVAIEQQVDFTDDRNIPKIRDIFPEPVNLEHLAEFRKDIKILARLTIAYTNNSIGHYMVSYIKCGIAGQSDEK